MKPIPRIITILLAVGLLVQTGAARATDPEDIHAGLFPNDGSELAHTAARALAAYQACQTADPDSAATRNNLGVLYILLNELDNADSALNGAVSQALNDGFGFAGIKMNMGVAASARDLSSEANDLYDEALADITATSLSAIAPQVYYNLAWEAYGGDDLSEALTQVDKTITHTKTNAFLKAKAHILRGAIYYKQGEIDSAMDDFNAAAALDPDGPMAGMAADNIAAASFPILSLAPQNCSFDALSAEIVATFGAPGLSPRGLTYDGTHLWNADPVANEIFKLDLDGNVSDSFDSVGINPMGIAYDGQNLFVSDSQSKEIDRMDRDGTHLDSFDAPGILPNGLAFDGTNFWSTDGFNDSIYVLDSSGNILDQFDSPGSAPSGIVFDGTYLWVADSTSDMIYLVDSQAKVLGSFDSPGTLPSGLAFDGTYLWHADSQSDSLYKIQAMLPISMGGDSTRQFTITNIGHENLEISAITIDGVDAAAFSITDDGCTGATVASKEAATFQVVFQPKSAGTKTARLTIVSNDPDQPELHLDLTGMAADACPDDPDKLEPGVCGCGTPETDGDGDGSPDCEDDCPADPDKTAPGTCGCGTSDGDNDGDGTPDCNDDCPADPDKIDPGACGCGVPEGNCAGGNTDTDGGNGGGGGGGGGCFIAIFSSR